MKQIMFFHPSPEWDGLARVFVEAGHALAARGVTVGIACPPASDVASGCTAFDLLPFEPRESWFGDTMRFATMVREFRANTVVVAGDEAHALAAWALRRNGRGTAVLRRMPTGIVSPVTFRTRLAVRLAPTWFMHSSAAEATASAPVKGLRGRIVADLAIDPAQFDRVLASPTPIGTTTIAIVTDPDARRATAAALRTIAAMRSRGHPIRALLIGTPPDANEVRVHATALGLGDALALVGDPIDRAPLLAAADLVWVAADHDDGGIAVLDAMALRRPVISTRGAMAERYIRHGETGMIVDREDAMANAATLTHLLDDPAQLDRLADVAGVDARARRTLSTVADAIMTVLDQATAARVAA
ncbi:MAG: glycosyltransferase family 4 protein [Gemmatimonadaceae bacterium]|nr:glycosyltransferase family 4 protein [Gemmatimonadaceae bacterium]